MKITLEDGVNRGFIEGPFRASEFELLKCMPDQVKWKDRILYFKKSAANVEYLKEHFGSANWANRNYLQELEALRQMEHDAALSKRDSTPAEPPKDYQFKKQPYQHQLKALALSRDKTAFGYFMDMGCVDADTEYLSPTGWKRIADYDGGLVAQFDDWIEMVQPTGFLAEPHTEPMLHFLGDGVDQLVTAGHRMLFNVVGEDTILEHSASNLALRNLEEELELPTIEDNSLVKRPLRDVSIRFRSPAEPMKYCFQVPSGKLVLRRNGGVFITGNTGKSKTAIDDMCWLYLNGRIDCVLVFAPNGVHRQWVNEQLVAHVPDNVPYKAWFWTAGKKLDPAVMKPSSQLRVFAMNIEALASEKGFSTAQEFVRSGRCVIILDESSRIKNPSAKRTKAALKLRDFAPYRRILSGTPITKGVEDLYSQFAFLDPNILGFSSYYTFRNRFCKLQAIPGAPAGAVKIVGYQNLDELQRKVDGHTFRVKKEECLDLPPKIYTHREVELTPEQRKLYVELRDDFFTQLQDGTIVDGALAITRLMRLQQVLSGFLPTENGIIEIPTNRPQTTLECVEEAPGKVIVWCRFHYDIDKVAEELRKAKIGYVTYDGRVTSSDKRAWSVDQFRNNPDVKVMLAQQQAGGTGNDWQVADTVIYHSNDFNADNRWQSEDRAHRIGQTKSVNYIDLWVPGTVDVKIALALRDKKSIAELALNPNTLT